MGLEIRVNEKIVYLSDESFESDVLQAEHPVLGRLLGGMVWPLQDDCTILEEIADEYDGRLTVAKLNIDDNANTPPKYGIRGIPTLMLFKGGAVEATKVGGRAVQVPANCGNFLERLAISEPGIPENVTTVLKKGR